MSTIGKNLKNKIVLRSPRVTEKSTVLAEGKSAVYVFEVSKETSKHEVAQAFKEKYNVMPVKVNVVNLPKKKLYRRGRVGTRSGVKKALVFLKPGDKVEIV